MTVNELMAELRKLQRDGHGSLPIFTHVPGTGWCTRVEKVKNYGFHVVSIGEDPSTLKD